jgi:hypothetical protein
MNLNEAKQAAYSAAHRASAKIKTMMQVLPPPTVEDAAELIHMGNALTGAAREIQARLQGLPEKNTNAGEKVGGSESEKGEPC